MRIAGSAKAFVPLLLSILCFLGCGGGTDPSATTASSHDTQGTNLETARMNVHAVPRSFDEMLVSWIDLSSVEDGYIVQRSLIDRNHFVEIARLGANQCVYQDKNLANDRTYRYRVVRIEGDRLVYSTETPMGTPFVNDYPPASPSLLRATPVDAHAIEIFWLDNADNETGYRVRATKWMEPVPDVELTLPPNSSSALIEGLQPNTKYSLVVQAMRGDSASTGTRTYPSGGLFWGWFSSYVPGLHATTLAEPNTVVEVEEIGTGQYGGPTVIGMRTSRFNALGLLERIEIDRYDSPDPIDFVKTYTYDANMNCLRVESDQHADETIESWQEYTYDGNHNVLTYHGSDGSRSSSEYDALGRTTRYQSIYIYNGVEVVAKDDVVTYETGRETYTGLEDKGISYYDSHGYLSRYESFGGFGEIPKLVEITDIFSDDAVWRSRDADQDGIPEEVGQSGRLYTTSWDDDDDGAADRILMSGEAEYRVGVTTVEWVDDIGPDFNPERSVVVEYTELDSDMLLETRTITTDADSDGIPDDIYISTRVLPNPTAP